MKLISRLVFIFVFLISFSVYANQYTHAIGDTGYMITEAMWADALIKDPSNYNKAIRLQREAKQYLNGSHKNGRSVSKAMDLTKEAYEYAKTARDNALQMSGKKVSY